MVLIDVSNFRRLRNALIGTVPCTSIRDFISVSQTPIYIIDDYVIIFIHYVPLFSFRIKENKKLQYIPYNIENIPESHSLRFARLLLTGTVDKPHPYDANYSLMEIWNYFSKDYQR